MSDLPHQKERNQYYEEKKTNHEAWKNWQVRPKYAEALEWLDLRKDPEFVEENEYRRKPRFIEINGLQVPEPYRGKIFICQTYYFPCVRSSKGFFKTCWTNGAEDTLIQVRGFLHLEESSARIHAKALGFLPEGE